MGAEYWDGKRAGGVWAMTKATQTPLRRLDQADADGTLYAPPDGADVSAWLAEILKPIRNRYDLPLWEAILGDDAGRIDHPDFARGFADGVVEAIRQGEGVW